MILHYCNAISGNEEIIQGFYILLQIVIIFDIILVRIYN